MPDPMTSGMWCSWVEINEKKARELGIAQLILKRTEHLMNGGQPYPEI
jgi:hypothetical protein